MNDNINMDNTISWSVLSFIFLIYSMYWPWYCTVHVYVVIHFSDLYYVLSMILYCPCLCCHSFFWSIVCNINMDSTISWSVHTIDQKNEWQHKHGQYNIMDSTFWYIVCTGHDTVLSMFMLSFIFLIYSMYWPWYCTVHDIVLQYIL
jgi:hypothetical protein